ncbi:MAG: hypothetical protein V4819_16355 [Verrucomicrobiota bacterium]
MNSNKQPNPCARDERAYDEHARSLHSKARDAYPAWLAGPTPDERRRAESLGVTLPPDDDAEVGGHSPYSITDIGEIPLARVDVDYAAAIDQPHDILADDFNITAEKATAILAWHQRETQAAVEIEKANYLQLIVGGLLSSKNPKLNAAGLAFANNLAILNGLPCQREYARQNHVSPSAVSEIVKQWQVTLGLRPSAHQKSEKACDTYSAVGKTRHWRTRPFTAGLATSLLSRLRQPAKPDID